MASGLPPYPAFLYAALHRGNAGDVSFYKGACEGAQRILELGCGDGRVLLELAAADRELVGLDVHDGLLGMARARGLEVKWVLGDMRAPPDNLAAGSFDRVIVPFGGLYCMLSGEELDAALGHAFALLKPGGELVFDVWAADDFHHGHDPDEQSDAWQDHLGRFDIDGRAWEIIERSEWQPAQQRIDVTYTHVPVGEDEAVIGELPQRYFLREEAEARLKQAGFSECDVFGDFAGGAYEADSEVLVVRARR